MTEQDLARKDAKRSRQLLPIEPLVESAAKVVVDAIYKLHSGLGPGLLESVYESVLQRDLRRRNLQVERQKPITFIYDGLTFVDAFRVDLFVNSSIVIEIKSVEHVLPVHSKQLLTYLRLLNLRLGFLMNFGAPTMKLGLRRIINSSVPSTASRLGVHNANSGAP